jgi:hypothetical protein
MPTLSEWSFARLIIVSIAWVSLVVTWQVLRFYLLFRQMRAESAGSGSGGIGAVSVGMFGIASVLFGPPILLLIVWLVLRYLHRV